MVLRPKDRTKPAKVQIPAQFQLIVAITLVKEWSLRPPWCEFSSPLILKLHRAEGTHQRNVLKMEMQCSTPKSFWFRKSDFDLKICTLKKYCSWFSWSWPKGSDCEEHWCRCSSLKIIIPPLTRIALPRGWRNLFETKKKEVLVCVFLGGHNKIMIIANI